MGGPVLQQDARVVPTLVALDPRSRSWGLGVTYEDTFTAVEDSVATY